MALYTHDFTGPQAPQGRKQRIVLSPCDTQGNQGPQGECGFHKTMQQISNRAQSRSRASCSPAPFSFQGADTGESLFKPRCAGGHINPLPSAQGSHPRFLMALTTDFVLPSASTVALPPCSQPCPLSAGHPRGEQACRGNGGHRRAQIPCPPVQAGPRQGTSTCSRSPLCWEAETLPQGIHRWVVKPGTSLMQAVSAPRGAGTRAAVN